MTRHTALVVVLCVVLVVVECLPSEAALDRQKRGFRNSALSTARGFGKRTKGDWQQVLDNLGLTNSGVDRAIPATWFADQVNQSPALAKLLVDKLVDLNGDGIVTQDELYQAL